MLGTQISFQLDMPPPMIPAIEPVISRPPQLTVIASGEKSKARDILAAIRTVKTLSKSSGRHRGEKQILARFGGFGAIALSIFPTP